MLKQRKLEWWERYTLQGALFTHDLTDGFNHKLWLIKHYQNRALISSGCQGVVRSES
jgi:hypothetical protein